MAHHFRAPALLGAALFVAACASSGENIDQVNRPDRDETGGGNVLGQGNESKLTDLEAFRLLDGSSGDGLTPVNRFLWRASLDTLAFLPLNSTDPFTGVIATDWAASPDAPNERFKVAAYVKSAALSATALQVALFREIRDPSGVWVTAPVSSATARQLEDAILVRARQLKIAERERG